jgi:hypothetical protein
VVAVEAIWLHRKSIVTKTIITGTNISQSQSCGFRIHGLGWLGRLGQVFSRLFAWLHVNFSRVPFIILILTLIGWSPRLRCRCKGMFIIRNT